MLARDNRLPDKEQLDKDVRFASQKNPLVKKLLLWRNNIIAHLGAKVSLGYNRILENNPLGKDEIESLLDEIAEICDISPLEIRRKNGYKQGSLTASGQRLSEHTVSLLQVIDEATTRSHYEEKRQEYNRLNQSDKRFKYGIGFSCSFRGCSLGAEGTDTSSAIVSVQADGSVYLLTVLATDLQWRNVYLSDFIQKRFYGKNHLRRAKSTKRRGVGIVRVHPVNISLDMLYFVRSGSLHD